MPTFEFTVALDRAPIDDDYDRIFEAGLDDTTPETRDGHGVLNVHREAASMSAAIISVVHDVAQAGFRTVGIEDDDLVSLKTIAQRMGRSYESVRLLSTGKRGPGEFPEALSGDGWALYSWASVAEWYTRNYGADAVQAVSPDQRIIAAAALLLRAVETAGPATAELGELIGLSASQDATFAVADDKSSLSLPDTTRIAWQVSRDALDGLPAGRGYLKDIGAIPGVTYRPGIGLPAGILDHLNVGMSFHHDESHNGAARGAKTGRVVGTRQSKKDRA